MKKILISFLILFFAVAFVRFGTSIYENIRRRGDGQEIYTGIVQDDEYTIDELIWSNQN